MKRTWTGLMFVSTFGLSNAVLAQQAPDELRVTLGVKAWVNTWETWLTPARGGGTGLIASRGGTEVAAIPNLSVNYGDFYGAVGYSTKTKYTFPTYTDVGAGGTTFTYVTSAKREEADVNLGYWILKGQSGGRLGVSIGYKQVNQVYGGSSFINRNKGWTVGLTGSAPLDSGWNIYANGAYGPMKLDSNSGYYVSTEIGLAYPLAERTTLSAGYKVQIIDLNVNGQRGRDSTNGIIAGLNYTF